MMQTRSASRKNSTDTSIEVNRNVAAASNKNTLNQNKRKTKAAQVGKFKKSKSSKESKLVVEERPMTEQDIARNEYMEEFMRNNLDRLLSLEELRAVNDEFYRLADMPGSKIVEEYFEKHIAVNGIDLTTKILLNERSKK